MSRRRSPKRSSKPASRPAAEADCPAAAQARRRPPRLAPSPGAGQKRFLAVAVVLELAWLAFLVTMAVATR